MRVKIQGSHPSHSERVAHVVHIAFLMSIIAIRRTDSRDPVFDKLIDECESIKT